MDRNRLATRLVAAALISGGVTAPLIPRGHAPAMLSSNSFAKAVAFIDATGRPLERALAHYYLAHGSRDDVMAELTKFQNPDGGFATILESDARWHGSSPMATRLALGIMHDVDAPVTDPRVRRTVAYLVARIDTAKGYWHALPEEVNSAPHAPWWHFHEATGKCDVESPVFPTAAIAGYLRDYGSLLPAGLLDHVTISSLNYLMVSKDSMAMSDVEMLVDLVEQLPPAARVAAVGKLDRVLSTILARSPHQWKNYSPQPLMYVRAPQSPFYRGLEQSVEENLDYVIATQQPDGGWTPNWTWEMSYPADWEVAKREWRAELTLENLRLLDAFHRIAR